MAYNNDQGEEEEEEEEEQDPYRGYPPQYYPRQPSQPHGYRSNLGHSEDVELRSPGVVRRFTRDLVQQENGDVVVMEESQEGGLKKQV